MRSDELCDLIKDGYEAALDPELWPAVLTRVADYFKSACTHFIALDNANGRALFGAVGRFPQEEHNTYSQDYAHRDLRLPLILATPPGIPITDQKLSTPEVVRSCPVYNEFFTRLDIHYFLGVTSRPTASSHGILAVLRSPRAAPYDREQLAAFHTIGEHYGQALRISLRLGALESRAESLSRCVDGLAFGLLVTDANGRILLANASAEAMLKEADGLSTRAGQLATPSRKTTARLRSFIAAAAVATDGALASPGGTLAVPRPLRTNLQLLVAPLPRSSTLIGEEPEGAAVILITDPEAALVSMSDALVALFGLTRAEARLTEALAGGASVREFADAQRITFETARTHLKRVFSKTGVHRQSELVRLVHKSPLALVLRTPRE